MSASRTSKRDSTTIVASLDPMTSPTVPVSHCPKKAMVSCQAPVPTGRSTASNQRSLTSVHAPRRVSLVGLIASSVSKSVGGCICAGPERSLAWDSNKWLPPFSGNYRCDCLRKVDLGTGGRGNQECPAITMCETTSRAPPCLAGRCQVGWPYTGPSGGPVAFRHCSAVHDPHQTIEHCQALSAEVMRPADRRE